jgi:hypothetical protein
MSVFSTGSECCHYDNKRMELKLCSFCCISIPLQKLNSGRTMGIIFSEQMFIIQLFKIVPCCRGRHCIITVTTKTSSFLEVLLA